MKTLVTGANGFIGSALVRKLLGDGHEVRCLAHRGQDRLQGQDLQVVRGSVTEPATLAAAVSGVEVVFHLAARASDWGPRELFMAVNAEGTRNLLAAAAGAGVRRFVQLSSLAVHPFTGYLDADETVPIGHERYPYCASKAQAERYVREAQARGGLETTIVRPGAVIHGPGDTTSFVFMGSLLEKGRWTHVKGGRPYICYSFVENLADGLVLAATHPKGAGETFIITDDVRLTWRELIGAIIKAFGARERTFSFPVPIARAAGITAEALFKLFGAKNPPPITDYRTAIVAKDFHFTCAKAKRVLGYAPRVPFEEGLLRTVEWYREWKAR
jgi:dihydroflavonol-4-reductase